VLGAEPVLHGLLEPFDFPLGLGVVRFPVLLGDAEAAQFGFQGVAAAPAAREPGSEDQPVIGQSRGRGAVGGGRGAERGQDGRAGDPDVGGERESVAGVVIEPGQDLGVLPAGERVVGEVGLPALVGLLGGEANAGDLGRFAASGVTRPWRARVRLTVAAETRIRWWCSRCQQMVCGPASRPCPARSLRSPAISSTVPGLIADGEALGRRDRGSNAASPSAWYRRSRV
jgi:hypothetical protein